MANETAVVDVPATAATSMLPESEGQVRPASSQDTRSASGRVDMGKFSVTSLSGPGWTMTKDGEGIRFERLLPMPGDRIPQRTQISISRLQGSRLLTSEEEENLASVIHRKDALYLMKLGAKPIDVQHGSIQRGEQHLYWQHLKFADKGGNPTAVGGYIYFSKADKGTYDFRIQMKYPRESCSSIELDLEPLLQVVDSLRVKPIN